jgi:hypothetical protein
MRLIQAGTTDTTLLQLYFAVVQTDGISPALDEAGGQPQISTNGTAWTNSGIGVLVAIGNGRYYAALSASAVLNPGDEIETRYASVNTAEIPGDSVTVVSYDPIVDDPFDSDVPGTYAPGTAGYILGHLPMGSGSILVDHNYGGPDALAYVTAEGSGINDATILAYLTTDYDADNLGGEFIQGRSSTNAEGEWVNPMLLDPGDYTLVYSEQGLWGPNTVNITVS